MVHATVGSDLDSPSLEVIRLFAVNEFEQIDRDFTLKPQQGTEVGALHRPPQVEDETIAPFRDGAGL
jgi:hypothetical protein